MNNDLTIEDLKRLAGIGAENKQPQTIVFVPDENFTHRKTETEHMRSLLEKLKLIDSSEGEDWNAVYIGGVKYWATGITNDKPTIP